MSNDTITGGELATFPHGHAGRTNQGFDKLTTFFSFNLGFSFNGRGFIGMLLSENQFPWSFSFCVFGSALIIPINPFIKILSGTDIVAMIFEAL